MRFLAALFLIVCLTTLVRAEDWPQWLGPNRDGVTKEVIAPWKKPPTVAWRQPAGEGHSSPVVAGGRLYFHAKVAGKEAEEVFALDAKTGKEVWKYVYDRPEVKTPFGNGPEATPLVQGKQIWTLGLSGVLTCLTADTGKLVWQIDLKKDFQAPKLTFGVATSPLLEGDNLLVNVGAKGAGIVAFHKDTGKVVWQATDDGASYASPIVFGKGKDRQAVFLTQPGVVSVNPVDGKVLWRFPFKDRLLESSTTPVKAGDLILISSITQGTVGLKLETKDAEITAKEAWKQGSLTSYFSTPIASKLDKEVVFIVTSTNPLTSFGRNASATLRCVEADSGKELWNKEKVGKFHATLLKTGDGKLLLLEEPGELVLLQPNAKNYEELARAKICGETWAHPAISDGKLFIRDNKEILCLEFVK